MKTQLNLTTDIKLRRCFCSFEHELNATIAGDSEHYPPSGAALIAAWGAVYTIIYEAIQIQQHRHNPTQHLMLRCQVVNIHLRWLHEVTIQNEIHNETSWSRKYNPDTSFLDRPIKSEVSNTAMLQKTRNV